MHWGRDLVPAVQEYTNAMWKARNEALHRSNKEENMEIKKQKCKQTICQVYQMPRHGLMLEDKKIFRQPVRFRLKLGYSAMRQWIEMAEHIFQRRMDIKEKQQINWYFPIQHRNNGEKDNDNRIKETSAY